MYTRKFEPPARSYFLLGPRGTGKTFWLRGHYDPESARFFDLLDPSTFLRLSRDPGAFRQEVAALEPDCRVVIDEVQRLPRLLDDVHHFLAQPASQRQFVLSGSSARRLKRSSANLLAGRASQRFFFPLVAAEHGAMDDVDALLRFGSLPEVLNQKDDKDRIEFLESYAVTYLREEIQQEAAARNIDSFSRFLEVAALMNGQVVNVAGLARDAGVARMTVAGYFQALEDSLVGTWLRAWRPRRRVKEVQHPKFFFFDPGVARVLSGCIRKPLAPQDRGFLLETYLLNELRAWNGFNDWGARLSFWRSPSKTEIDLVLEFPDRRVGIEVKAGTAWKREYAAPLVAALEEGFLDRIIGVYLGAQRRRQGKLDILPLKDFLDLLARDRL